MRKYIKIYRVIQQTNSDGESFSDNQDDTYIPCKKNCQIYRYSPSTLALLIPSQQIANKYASLLSDYLTEQSLIDCAEKLTGETILYFDEKYLTQVSTIVQAKTSGSGISPSSIKNLSARKQNKKEYDDYDAENEDSMNELQLKLKELVSANGNNIRLYIQYYKFLESELDVDIIQFAKDSNIKPIQAIDSLEVTDQAIKLLDKFMESL